MAPSRLARYLILTAALYMCGSGAIDSAAASPSALTGQPSPPAFAFPVTESPHWPHFANGLSPRIVHVLNGTWQTAYLGENVTVLEPPPLHAYTTTAQVPEAFDREEGPRPYARGTIAYRAEVTLARPGSASVLRFGGCSLWCAVYVDGQRLVSFDAGGYTPFYLDVPLASASAGASSSSFPSFDSDSATVTRELVVLVDNRFDEANRTATQHQRYGFYQFGGLLRSVEWHELAEPWRLQRVVVAPFDAAAGTVNVTLVVVETETAYTGAVTSAAAANVQGDVRLARSTVELRLIWDGDASSAVHLFAQIGVDGCVRLPPLRVPNFRLWSPATPVLHRLAVQWLSSSSPTATAADPGPEMKDGMEVRFGLRQVAVHGRRVAINGEPVVLKGFNRHEMHPAFGSGGLPMAQLLQDVEIIAAAGANWVRGCHYLQDQRWLDLLDERGILFWEEVSGGDKEVPLGEGRA